MTFNNDTVLKLVTGTLANVGFLVGGGLGLVIRSL
jgi:hypothetical protein